MIRERPTAWTFDLDERTTSMSLVSIVRNGGPIFATPDTVDELIASFEVSETTPEGVTALLDMSRKLLAASVIHHEFAAVAIEKSLQAVELAVRIRLYAGKNATFVQLINRVKVEAGFADDDVDALDTGRILRNRVFAHPTGVVAFPLVMCVDGIRTSHKLVGVLFPSADSADRVRQ